MSRDQWERRWGPILDDYIVRWGHVRAFAVTQTGNGPKTVEQPTLIRALVKEKRAIVRTDDSSTPDTELHIRCSTRYADDLALGDEVLIPGPIERRAVITAVMPARATRGGPSHLHVVAM